MARKENRVQFNLKNVAYAVLTQTDGTASWEPPVKVPGAVTLTLDAEGDVTPFYADGIAYYQAIANGGYSGSLEMARYPDKMMQDIWGFILDDTDKVMLESANAEPKPFALLYQIDGDADNQLYCLYNCSGTRPGIGSTTNTNTKEPQTQTSNISASALENGTVLVRTTAQTPDNVRQAWYTAVYVPKDAASGEAGNEESN